MPATLKPETQAAIDKAFDSKSSFNDAVAADNVAQANLTAAMKTANNADDASLTAQKKYADDSHAALVALALEFDVQLPS